MKLKITHIKPTRRLTLQGWILTTLLLLGLFIGFLKTLYPFLSPEHQPHQGLMIVEGWINDSALDEAVCLFRAGNYSKIICTGVLIETGSYIQSFKSYPEMTAARLRELGIDEKKIMIAVAKEAPKDRTYLAAVALHEALIAHHIKETQLHLITTGPHGRRSRLLFQKALGREYQLGITCLEDTGYDPEHWYTYSQGVRKVISELIAYTYAKLFFHP